MLVTFHPHPRKVLYPDSAGRDLKLITTLEEKCMLLEEAGLDHLVILEFTASFARTTSTEFVEKILAGGLRAHTIVVGFNHFFGYNKEGSFRSLYQDRKRYGYHVEEIPEQEIQHETVSSTRIRKALLEGHMQRANAYLESHFMIRGRTDGILHPGEQGRYGYRLEVNDSSKLIPPPGAYAISYQTDNGIQKGLVRIAENGIDLYPLIQESGPGEGKQTIHFYKQIDPTEPFLPDRALETIKELIY